MRVLHLGNTNNIGYAIARSLREFGVESTLLVDRSDFITSDCSWEDPELKSKPCDWIKYYRNTQRHRLSIGFLNIPFPYFHRLEQSLDLAHLAREYDILQAYNYDTVLCLSQPRKPFIAFCIGGDLNVTALSSTIAGQLMRMAYRRANFVFYSNINMIESIQKLALHNAYFMPLPIDTTRYRPDPRPGIKEELDCDILLLSPTRHAWATKGNDKLIRAFAQLVKESPLRIKLVLCAWGEDLTRSRALCYELGVEESIVWRPLMPKPALIKYYNASDIVLDQFNCGAWGLTTLEAMACGKAVVLNYRKEWAEACYTEIPPVCYASSTEEIFELLKDFITHPQRYRDLGKTAREWVIRHHSSNVVARRHLEFYHSIIG
jgi:glycosyltransferase involved in cell wall biosynthesis